MGVWIVAGTINSLTRLDDPEPWFKFVVSGPTKGNQLSGSKFAIPIVGTTHLELIWNRESGPSD
eukprot:scaffold16214_cov29-Attheya_sp.AAC.2